MSVPKFSATRSLRVFSGAFKYSNESIGNLLFIRLPECKMGYYGSHRSSEKNIIPYGSVTFLEKASFVRGMNC